MSVSNLKNRILPYLLKEENAFTLKKGGNYFKILNRQYEPIDNSSFFITNEVQEDLKKEGAFLIIEKDKKGIYLYNDSINPHEKEHQESYFKKLSLILHSEIV